VTLEGELAAAIAHELAHQQLGHYLIHWRRRVNFARDRQGLLDFGGDWRSRFLGKNGALYLSPEMEQEADNMAPVILYLSRFDPRLYTSYLQTLRKLEKSEVARVAAILSLHPPIKDRLAWAKAGQVRVPPLKDASVSSQTFQRIKMILNEAAKKAPAKGPVE
jgi:predicted Zn-dependent protease